MKTWQDKQSPLYDGLPYMEIEGAESNITYPSLAELKVDGEFVYVIKTDKVYLANKKAYGRIRTDMAVTDHLDLMPKDTVLLGELIWGAGKDFYDFARHKLDPNCNLVIFGCVRYKGIDLSNWTYKQTRQLLESQTFYNSKVVLVPSVFVEDAQELQQLFDKFTAHGYEGVVVKKPTSKYKSGKSYDWSKKKLQAEADLVICGYQTGTKRAKTLSVLVGHRINGKVEPFVHVGGGFTKEEKETLLKVLKECTETGKLDKDILIEPKIVIKVIHSGVVRNVDGSANSLRHPRFDRFRFDKTVNEIDTIK